MQRQELKLKLSRSIVALLPQILILMYFGGKHDLVFGLNRSDYGFTVLLFLFVLTPIITLIWLIVEFVFFVKFSKRSCNNKSRLWPILALLLFIESILIDIFLLTQAKM